MKNIFGIFVLIILGLSTAADTFAGIELTINRHKIVERQAEDETISKKESDTVLSVFLSGSYFSYIQDGTQYIYDLDKKRIIAADLTRKIYSDDSLFADIGFRTYELKNRLRLGGALAAGEVKNNPMMPVLTEHLFSIEQKDLKSVISRKEKNDTVSFIADGKELLSYSNQGLKVSRENKEMFVKFFRYVFGGHPQILDELSSNTIIPKTINICRFDGFRENNNLNIEVVETSENRDYSIAEYKPAVLENEPDEFTKFIYDLKYSNKIDYDNHIKSLLQKATIYYESGNYFDTLLAYIEYNLVSSLPFPSEFSDQKAIIDKDENVMKLLACLSPKNKEEAETCLKDLQSLEAQAKHHSHVLKIFLANTYVGFREYEKAKNLFLETLKINPHIAGAYKDLGGIFFSEYDTVLAWRCWDMARQIAPSHKMLAEINEFESNLYKMHPQYF